MYHKSLTKGLSFVAVVSMWMACPDASAQPAAKKPSLVGSWEIKGQDTAKVKWTGALVLTTGDKGALAGHIDWSGSDGTKGREIVRGSFDPATRILKLKGEKLERANGLTLGDYSAVLSEDGTRIEKGKWTTDAAPGGWEAKRLADDPGLIRNPKTGFVHKKFKLADGSVADYGVFVPHSYDGVKEVPVILFLHGSGETKGEGGKPLDVGIGPFIAKHERTFPFLVLIPQAQEKGWRPRGVNGELALGILDKTLKEYKTDAKRVYLTGLSMGGIGTWNFALAEPERWAALVPICGAGNPDKVGKIKDMPCWVFHGAADDTIPVTKSREMVAALKKAGGNPKYTEFPGVGHVSWDRAYATPGLWKWLGEQKRE